MAVLLNTSDPLYSKLTALICVDPATNTIVEAVSGRTVTTSGTVLLPNSGTPSSTAPYGPSFRTKPVDTYSPSLVGLSPNLTMADTANVSSFIVVNKRTASTGGYGLGGALVWREDGTVAGFVAVNGPHTAALDGGGHSIAYTRDGAGAQLAKVFPDGVLSPVYAGGKSVGYGTIKWDPFGGELGQGTVDADFVFCAFFNSYLLTDADVSRLHASLTGGGAFALLASAPADTTAPTLSAAVGTQTGQTTATVGATTNEANGTMYAVVTTSATPPSVTQIQAGNDNTGAAAKWAGSVAVTTVGAKTFSATGLTASTAYYGHTQQKDAAGNNSTVLTSSSFTTASSGGGNATPTFSGTIPDINLVNGAALSWINAGAMFADDGTLTYSKIGSWPAWLSLNTSTGAISGTANAVATVSGLKVRGTDTGSLYAESNAFSVTVSASGGGNATPTFSGTISNITGTVGVAIATVSTASKFADDGTLTYSKQGTWPSWMALNASTGDITGTPDTAATSSNLKVRATDSASQYVDSNAFSVAIAAGGGGSGSVTLGPFANATGAGAITSVTVYYSFLPGWRVGNSLPSNPVHGSGTLNGSGFLTIASGLPAATWGEMKVGYRTTGNAIDDQVFSDYVLTN